MAQVCELCGRGPQFGNRISHAHNVTKRRWNINLQSVRALVKGAGKRVRGRFTLTSLEEKRPGQIQFVHAVTVEIEGEDKPALIADWIGLVFT